MGHHAGQLAVAQGADDRDDAGDEPDEEQESGRADGAGYIGADDEDAGADHGAHDDHHGVEEGHLAPEAAGFGFGDGYRGIGVHGLLLNLLFRMP